MSDMPKRIWAIDSGWFWAPEHTWDGDVEYIRASAIDTEALAARMARHLRANGDIDDDAESEAGCLYELKAILDAALEGGERDE